MQKYSVKNKVATATTLLIREWGKFDLNLKEDENLLRLSIISRGNSFCLHSLTTELTGTGICIGTQKEYPLHKTIEQIISLSADEALQLYYDAEKQYQEAH